METQRESPTSIQAAIKFAQQLSSPKTSDYSVYSKYFHSHHVEGASAITIYLSKGDQTSERMTKKVVDLMLKKAKEKNKTVGPVTDQIMLNVTDMTVLECSKTFLVISVPISRPINYRENGKMINDILKE